MAGTAHALPVKQTIFGQSRGSSFQVNVFGRMMGKRTQCERGRRQVVEDDEEEEEGECSMPVLAAIERVRSLKRKADLGPRGRSKAVRKTKQTGVSIRQRLTEFPDEGLKESAGKLFCMPCKEELLNLKESIKRHVSSSKHCKKRDLHEKSLEKNKDLFNDLAEYFVENNDEKGVSCLLK